MTPPRMRGVEFLDDPATPDSVRRDSLRDLARSNALFGGRGVVLNALRALLPGMPARVVVLDVGTGAGDIAARVRDALTTAGVTATVIGIDAAEFTVDIGTSAKGYTTESTGHCTVVVDRASRRLVGAFLAGAGVSETIHEAVLAIRAGIDIDTLADTIHAFPTVARVLGTAFTNAAREL